MSNPEKYIQPRRGALRTEIARRVRDFFGATEVRRARKLATQGKETNPRQRHIVDALGYVKESEILRSDDI